jgi:hypothetical protein
MMNQPYQGNELAVHNKVYYPRFKSSFATEFAPIKRYPSGLNISIHPSATFFDGGTDAFTVD